MQKRPFVQKWLRAKLSACAVLSPRAKVSSCKNDPSCNFIFMQFCPLVHFWPVPSKDQNPCKIDPSCKIDPRAITNLRAVLSSHAKVSSCKNDPSCNIIFVQFCPLVHFCTLVHFWLRPKLMGRNLPTADIDLIFSFFLVKIKIALWNVVIKE